LKNSVIKANTNGGEFRISPAADLPYSQGIEYSYSIWLFVDNITNTDTHKIVLYRGNSQSYANGYFFVYMDKDNNKLYASVRTTGVEDDSPSSAEPQLEDIRRNKYFLQSEIDYIPLQRWVNVTYTLRETVFSTYLDGELYSVASIYEMPVKPNGTRVIPQKPKGDVMIGGTATKPGFTGYLGNNQYCNFALTMKETKVVYRRGPYTKSFLSYLGLGNVGIRTPVYKIEAKDV
jgi:hypothetical protein